MSSDGGTVEAASNGRMSNGDGAAKALAILEDAARRDNLPLFERVSIGLIACTGGDGANPTTYGDVAEVTGLSVDEVRTGLAWIAEHYGLPEDRVSDVAPR